MSDKSVRFSVDVALADRPSGESHLKSDRSGEFTSAHIMISGAWSLGIGG